MRRQEAESIPKARRPHSDSCRYKEFRAWDRSGECERCNAFIALNELNFGGLVKWESPRK